MSVANFYHKMIIMNGYLNMKIYIQDRHINSHVSNKNLLSCFTLFHLCES